MRSRHSFVLILGLALLGAGACGSDGGDDGDDNSTPTDADGDFISDADEGQPSVDTDGDGTPDFEDEDSDGDGVPDYREAGDEDLETNPWDSDNDGTPDFRDLDSDDNGIRDGSDSLDDTDGDGRADFQDLDDDADLMLDVLEIGDDPDAPIDTDSDGTPDYQDTDSDNDTIQDVDEGGTDFDQDGTPNFRDLDSDDDCRPDVVEAGGSPPIDTDDDGRFDFVDHDSDNDGISDDDEDANCNGAVDGNETSPTDEDSDNDGVTDLVEGAAGTDPNDPTDNPQANGDFVFIEPYEAPQSPTDDDLDFATDLLKIDVYLLIDRSGSMSGEIANVKTNLSAAIDTIQCPPNGTGTPGDCIPDLWAGGGTFTYSTTEPYSNYLDIQPNPTFSTLPDYYSGGATPTTEPETFALWSAITGLGTASAGCPAGQLATIAARTCTNTPAQQAGYTAYGYPCFRQGALPIVLLATDEAPLSAGSDTYKCPAWSSTVKNAYNARSAKIIGIKGDSPPAAVQTDLVTITTDVGAVDAANGNAPLVFNGGAGASATAIANGIKTAANGLPLDLAADTTDDPADTVDAIAAFVDHLETLQLGTADCSNGLNDIDTNADTFDDAYVDVVAGTPVCWKVVSKQNTTVQPTTEPQLFRATVDVTGDGITLLDSRDVFFLVPPAPFDPPVN